MFELSDQQRTQFAAAVAQAAGRADVRSAIEAIYRDLARRIDQRRPICRASGRCCRFDAYGHRLFVTTAEVGTFVAGLPGRRDTAAGGSRLTVLRTDPGGCMFQVGGLCTVHDIRPFGCRVFFCDPTSTQWQSEQYEHFQRSLRSLHDRLQVNYMYVEWRQALAAIEQAGILNGGGMSPATESL